MSRTFDVIVVGVGAMGAATCYHLAKRGVRVLGLERFDVPHELGSSGGQSRLTRMAYYESPRYVPLLRRAWENWAEVTEESGVELLYRTGILYLGRPEGRLLTDIRNTARECELEIEEVAAEDVAGRFGPFEVPEGMGAIWEEQAGFLLSQLANATHAELAMRHGGEIRAREPVLDWRSDRDGVTVRTARGEYSAGHLVLTSGAWSGELMKTLGVPLRVTRQVVAWVWPPEPDAYTIGAMPCWAAEDDIPGFDGIYYGFPLLPAERFAGERGLKVAHHTLGEEADPSTVDRDIVDGDQDTFRPALRRFLPAAAESPMLALKVCMYTNSPDLHFIIDHYPGEDRVSIACGFSGHGFKFASAVGEALADMATSGRTELPVGWLGLDRFGREVR